MGAEFEPVDSDSRAQAPNCSAASPSHMLNDSLDTLTEYVWSRADVQRTCEHGNESQIENQKVNIGSSDASCGSDLRVHKAQGHRLISHAVSGVDGMWALSDPAHGTFCHPPYFLFLSLSMGFPIH